MQTQFQSKLKKLSNQISDIYQTKILLHPQSSPQPNQTLFSNNPLNL